MPAHGQQSLPQHKKEDLLSEKKGFVKSIATRKLGLLLIELGGGRKYINDKIDFSVGIEKVINVGSSVDLSTPLLTVHAKSKENLDNIKKQIKECFNITEKEVTSMKTIYNLVS